jgi:hypothetical protein
MDIHLDIHGYPILYSFVSVAEPNEEIFQKCAMQKQKNAIFIHIWCGQEPRYKFTNVTANNPPPSPFTA